jgi:hypothetical protein
VEEPKDEEPPVEEPKDEEPPVEEPKKKKSKKTLFIVLGAVIIASLIGFAISSNDSFEIPNPPYIDENGNIDWDKKYEDEVNSK